jgi:hypothetical protein
MTQQDIRQALEDLVKEDKAGYFDDCDACKRRLALIAAAEAALASAPTYTDEDVRAMRALESLTPGGSEFAGDVKRCVDWIKDRINHNWEMAKKARRELNERDEDVRRLVDVVKMYMNEHNYQYFIITGKMRDGGCGCARCNLASAALAKFPQEPT